MGSRRHECVWPKFDRLTLISVVSTLLFTSRGLEVLRAKMKLPVVICQLYLILVCLEIFGCTTI